MDKLDNVIKNLDDNLQKAMTFVDNNEYVTAILGLILILYAAYAIPKLPNHILKLFDNPVFKLLIFLLIVYVARKNPTVAIILAVAVMLTLQTLNNRKIKHEITSIMQMEKMQNNLNQEIEQEGEQEGEQNVGPEMENIVRQEEEIPQNAVEGLEEETKSMPDIGCVRKMKYRNSFYPQYANMKPNAYMSRYNGNNVSGYDPLSGYVNL